MPADHDLLAPDFKEAPYWWDAAPPETALDPIPEKADVVVIGSGYAGLNAATELARAGLSVVVLDAERLGEGASTRAGGMVSSGQKLVVGDVVKGVAPDLFGRLIGESISSFEYLQDLVRSEKLDADLKIAGRFFGAHSAKQAEILRRNGAILAQKTGVTVRFYERAEQRAVVGSDYYHGGMVIDDYGGLHPAKYHKALRARAREAGVMLRSHARAGRITEGPGGTKVVPTARGTVAATHVVSASNGYVDRKATPEIARRVVPTKSYQIATEPLPADLLAELVPNARMVSDTRRDLIYSRPSPDGTRLLFGSRPGLFEVSDREAVRPLHERMTEIWPQLRGVKVTHVWSGYVAMTRDKVAHLGHMDNTDFAAGCNGNGVALMSYLGYQTAQKLLRRQNRPSAFDRADFPTIPLYSGSPWFLPIVSGWYRLRDKLDRPRR